MTDPPIRPTYRIGPAACVLGVAAWCAGLAALLEIFYQLREWTLGAFAVFAYLMVMPWFAAQAARLLDRGGR